MGNKRCILLTLIVGVLVFLLPTNVQASAKKLTGNDRYEISFAITQDGWKQVDNSYYAVLVLGDNFPDALSAAPLAKKYDAPILLTETKYIPTDTFRLIKQLKVSQVFIIGDTSVISPAVEGQLISLNIKTVRLGGKDRYETNIKVANQLESAEWGPYTWITDKKGTNSLNSVSEIAIVTGEDFADAMSIVSIAGKKICLLYMFNITVYLMW